MTAATIEGNIRLHKNCLAKILRRAHAQGLPKDYGIKRQNMFSASYPAPAASS